MTQNELYHFGVKGMKWGRRKIRGHAGPGKYATKKRQLAGDKKDLEALNKGQHLSAGVTKKRQAAYDARDRAALEKKIAKNETNSKQKMSKEQKVAMGKFAASIGLGTISGIGLNMLMRNTDIGLSHPIIRRGIAGFAGASVAVKYMDVFGLTEPDSKED